MAAPEIQFQPMIPLHVRKIIANLTLLDDDLMSKVFDENIPATELLLKIILQRDDIKVISVKGQYNIKNGLHSGRNVVLDVHAKDSAGKHYDIEVQRSNSGADVRRARFNSSMLDTRMLKSGQDFKELKDSYVIFITENDIFGDGLPVYTLDRSIRENQKYVNDGSHIVYVNGSYHGDNPIGKLMHDFREKRVSNIHYKELRDSIRHFKETEKGVTQMCDAVRKYGDERAARATSKTSAKAERKRIRGLCYIVKNLMKSTEYTLDQAIEAIGLNPKDRRIIMQRLG